MQHVKIAWMRENVMDFGSGGEAAEDTCERCAAAMYNTIDRDCFVRHVMYKMNKRFLTTAEL